MELHKHEYNYNKNNNCTIVAVKFRLNGSSEANQGRVEVNIGGLWGTVCDQGWDDLDARVLCK